MKKEAKRLTGKPSRRKRSLRLTLNKETLHGLQADRLCEVAGGRTRNTCGIACTVIDCV